MTFEQRAGRRGRSESPEKVPKPRELKEFMDKECAAPPDPYSFEWRAMEPLRIDVPGKIIYVGKEVLRETVKSWMKRKEDWKTALHFSVMHEKAHIRHHHLSMQGALSGLELRQMGIPWFDYGSLTSFIGDWVVNEIYYIGDRAYQDFFRREERDAFTRYTRIPVAQRALWGIFTINPYMAIAYHYAREVATEAELLRHFPEQLQFLIDYGTLLLMITYDGDIPTACWAAYDLYQRTYRRA